MTAAERKRLQRAKEIIAEHHDYKGRLHDETSGGNGMVKIQQIVAARDRKERYGGQKPTRGAAPDSFDKIDPSHDPADAAKEKSNPRRIIRFAHNWDLDESDKERLIDELASSLFEGEEASHSSESTLTCRLCGAVVEYWPNARAHLHQEYERGIKQRAFYREIRTAAESCDPTLQAFVKSVQTELERNRHLPVVEQWLRENAPKKTAKRPRRAA